MVSLKRWPPFNFRYLLFMHDCCFRLSEAGRRCSLFLPALGSACPFILTLGFSRFCVLNVRHVFSIFFFFAFSVSFKMVRCEVRGPSRAQVENRICSLRMQRGKKVGREGGMDGWRYGCRFASDVRPFKGESGNQSRPQPTWCCVPVSTSRHPSVSFFCFLKDSFILLFFFPHFFYTAFLCIVTRTITETWSFGKCPSQKLWI